MTGTDYLRDAARHVDQYRQSVAADLEAVPANLLWRRPVPGMVSAANLGLHLTGNLRHFIGHHLGGTDYVRTRDREFEARPWMEKSEIISLWQEACHETETVLTALDGKVLERDAPVDSYPGDAPTSLFILRLMGHLSYHAGQIRMLRRLLVPAEEGS